MFRFIENIGDYFSTNYFNEDFVANVIKETGYSYEVVKGFNQRIGSLKEKYFSYKNDFIGMSRAKDGILRTAEFHRQFLKALGYDFAGNDYDNLFPIKDNEVIPVRHKLFRGDKPHLFIMEMQSMIKSGEKEPDGLFDQRYNREQWKNLFEVPGGFKLTPSIVNEAISELFLLDAEQRPRYILLLAGSEVYLLNDEKWFKGGYLRFKLEELFGSAALDKNYYSLFYFLLARESLSPDADIVLMEKLDEASHKSAYAVTQDLKKGIINAVERLANEAVFYINSEKLAIDTDRADFADNLKNDCLTIVYRLLFLFYAESRDELEILPINDEVYEKGYSLEMLRDLEQVPLNSETQKNGYFFHESLAKLFDLLFNGYKSEYTDNESFKVNKLDSPLFDPRNLHILRDIKFRNFVWQDIVCQLSLSQQQNRRARGRISYANLGVNQLGSVYEGLLAFRGFFAKEDFIEVHKAGAPDEGTFVVERRRIDEFRDNEILKDENGDEAIIPAGTFVYRLSGRDRQQSASYYTPEVLTATTVKYTLKGIIERLESAEISADEILRLKILEPAMGAAAFQNEVINQLAVIYLDYKQKELKSKVMPDKYQDELQKVKAYIATNNVYGVDLNPTAVELGKLSLWLNVIHKEMETPYFGYRLGCGNAVVGAWLKVYEKSDLVLPPNSKRTEKREWWEKAPELISFSEKQYKNSRSADQIYHFLLPDKNMVPSADIKLLKKEFPLEAASVTKWRTAFCAPFREDEFIRLAKIADKVDELIEEHYRLQTEFNQQTLPKKDIFGFADLQKELIKSYHDKENLLAKRQSLNSPYYKLKAVMDYWCSLWFWDLRDAEHLPERKDFYSDIEAILDLNIVEEKYQKIKAVLSAEKVEQPQLFTIEEQIKNVDSQTALFKSDRLQIAAVVAKKYRFFHAQLEFIEVFKERGGFDVICGNPPWVKVSFDEAGILSEKRPEISIRDFSAPQVSALCPQMLADDESLKQEYFSSAILAESSKAFLSAMQIQPLLVGQKTDLYKCILANTFNLVGKQGFIGMVHPESVYDDADGKQFRKEIYTRLKYHFQFINELKLFAEIDHHNKFGIHIYKGIKSRIDFLSMHNLFTPTTIDASLVHTGGGLVGGVKMYNEQTGKYNWNIHPHKTRIIRFDEKKLSILAKTFENSQDCRSAKLVAIHANSVISVLEKISQATKCVSKYKSKIDTCWDERKSVIDGILKSVNHATTYPKYDCYEFILNGPHFFVGNPLYKSPKLIYNHNTDYNSIDLMNIEDNFLPKVKYLPNEDVDVFIKRKTNINDDKLWIDEYKLIFSTMLNLTSERTLQPAIFPPKVSHTNGAISIVFDNKKLMIEFASLTSSLVFDFYIKSKGMINLHKQTIHALPLGINPKFYQPLAVRTLLLNCLTKYYRELWEDNFDPQFTAQNWTISDHRLKPFNSLTKEWSWQTPLRNAFERRQALVEIDVITAMAFNLTLEELISIYNIQFPVLQQNEDDTYYDQNGRIIFTCNKGLSDVGLKRPEWERVKELREGEVKHIVNTELYPNKEVIYVAPFVKCDRVEDYRTAWKCFEEWLS